MGNPLINIEGVRFGRWTVGTQYGNRPEGGALWNVTCDCGTLSIVPGSDLRSGKSKSCGCLRRELSTANNTKHGGRGTRIYRIWKAMRERCRNPSSQYYGARGITVCEEWQDFPTFREWAQSSGYSDELSIDRIDNDLGYSPTNCRWATRQTQAENRAFVNKAPDGTPWSVIAKRNGISVGMLNSRVHKGWPFELAATLPKGSRRKRHN